MSKTNPLDTLNNEDSDTGIIDWLKGKTGP